MAADYSDTLFVTGEGAPMKFYIAPGKEKQELKPLIEKGGGVVTGNEDKSKSIQLSTSSPAPAGSTPFQYVHDCISENRLLSLTTYSSYRRRSLDSDAINEKDADDSGENEIERIGENENRTTQVKATMKKGRHPYNAEEDKKILDYVELHAGPAYGGTTGNRLWQHMEKMQVTRHSWQSMKSRYKRFIQPAGAKPKRKNKPELEMERAEGRRNDKKKTKKRVDESESESESESEDEIDSDSSFDGELFKAGEVMERRRDATPARRLPSKRRTLGSLLSPPRTPPKRNESTSKARRDVAASAPQLSSSARKKRESPPVKSDNPSKRKKLLTPFPSNSRNEDDRSTSSSHRNRHSNGSTPRSRRCLNEPMGRAKREEELRTRIKRIMSAYSKSHEQVSEALRCMSGNFDDACHFLEHDCSKTGQPPWTKEDDALLLSKSRAGKTLLLRKRSDLDVSRRIKFLESKPI